VAEARITREDVESAVGARRELGSELEPEIVDAFLERVERSIDARASERARASHRARRDPGQTLALSIVSLGTGIPITAIAAEQGGVLGIALAWAGIAAVNVANAWASRD
jgi:hypothetical protein